MSSTPITALPCVWPVIRSGTPGEALRTTTHLRILYRPPIPEFKYNVKDTGDDKISIKNVFVKFDAYLWKFKYRIYTRFFGVPPRSMIKQLSRKKDLIGVEIGVYRGDHAKSILNTLDMDTLYLVDPFCNYDEYTDDYGPEKRLNGVFHDTEKRLKKFADKIIFIRKNSSDACDDIPNKLDFVYIDGNHAYEFIKKDIELYWPKIKNGGIIGGHDISNGECEEHNGIITAVYEFAAEYNLQIYIKEPDWWLIKCMIPPVTSNRTIKT